MTREELMQLKIEPPEEEIRRQIKARWDGIAKPLDGMGSFERITAQIGAIYGSVNLDIGKKAVIVMCADNGIVEEGISQSGQEVTAMVSRSMGKQESSVGRMAKTIGADVFPVDVGINQKDPIPGVMNRKVMQGTRNFRKEPAMTEEETLQTIDTGIELARLCREKGYRLLATGEMGIGNTTTAAAVMAALLGCEPDRVTGRGAGLDDTGLLRKQQVIREALLKYQFHKEEPLRILATVGGLDIAGLAGVFIGGALYHLPVVMDGVISAVAALAAQRLVPGVRDFIIASHQSREPGTMKLMEELGVCPVIQADMALGEGTGAVMMFSLLDMALSIYNSRTTFEDISVEPYRRFSEVKS